MELNCNVINIHSCITSKEDEDKLRNKLAGFSCEYKDGCKAEDVENFLKNNAIEFAKKHQSVTYLVTTLINDEETLLGYFTLAIKPINVDAKIINSNELKKRILRIGKFNDETGFYSLSAYLIAQFAKNYNNPLHKLFSGKQLMSFAKNEIYSVRNRVGGTVIFLETEEKDELLDFYEKDCDFLRFDVRTGNEDLKLIQLLKVI